MTDNIQNKYHLVYMDPCHLQPICVVFNTSEKLNEFIEINKIRIFVIKKYYGYEVK